MNPHAGQLLSTTIRLVRPLATGGMGSVWLGEHLVLGLRVAVKVMSPQWALVPTAQQRFVREARMTASIDNPHVVRVIDCRMTEGDEPYLVLELLRGENLEDRVRRDGPLPWAEGVDVIAQACDAVAAAHHRGIVHRDLKPENVFLVSGTPPAPPVVKLLDFGVAKPSSPAECLDVDRLAAGTPQYMSPEHLFDPEATDERSDLFSLGAVAYFALTGRSPWAAETLQGLYLALDAGTFVRPSHARPGLPPELDEWFDKALAREPADRFCDAGSMARALEQAARRAREARAARAAPYVRPLRRRLLAMAGLAAVAFTLGYSNCATAPEPPAQAELAPR
jgi:serine/threonine protein kinase